MMLVFRKSFKLQGKWNVNRMDKTWKLLGHHGPQPHYHSQEGLVLTKQAWWNGRTGLEAKVLQSHMVIWVQFCLSQHLTSVPVSSQCIHLNMVGNGGSACLLPLVSVFSSIYATLDQCVFCLVICFCLFDSLLVQSF